MEQAAAVSPDAPSSAQGPSLAQGSAAALSLAPGSAPQQRAQVHKPFTQSRLPPDLPMHPAPRHVTDEELRVLEGCLHRWRSEVENDTRGMTTAAAAIFMRVRLTLIAHIDSRFVSIKQCIVCDPQ